MLQFRVNHASADQALGYRPMETMGERIRLLRQAKGWTQEQLADRLRLHGATVSGNAISQWERGETKDIKLRAFLALVEELDTTHEYLVHGPSEPGRDSKGKFGRLKPVGRSGNKP